MKVLKFKQANQLINHWEAILIIIDLMMMFPVLLLLFLALFHLKKENPEYQIDNKILFIKIANFQINKIKNQINLLSNKQKNNKELDFIFHKVNIYKLAKDLNYIIFRILKFQKNDLVL